MPQRIAGIGFVLALSSTGVIYAGDWANFRGPSHDGRCGERNLSTIWGDGPKVLWDREVGSAFSSFAAVGDRLYTCGTEDRKQVLICLDASTGEIIWKQPFEKEYRDQFGDGCRATPTVNDGRVYIVGAHGRVLCCDARTGAKVWSQNFDHKPQWGYSGSVLVEGPLAIFQAGGGDGALRAVDKVSGKLVWTCDGDQPGYSTPLPFSFNGRRYVCGFAANRAVVAEIETGNKALSIPWSTDWKVNAAAPVFEDGHLFLNSGYQTGCGLFKLTAKGSALAADEVWRSKVLLNKFQSAILSDGKLFASDEKALKCVDFISGKENWSVPRVSNGTIILADGKLWLLTEKGELQVGPTSLGGFQPTARAQVLSGRCWTVPIIYNGRLYARNLERCICLDLRG